MIDRAAFFKPRRMAFSAAAMIWGLAGFAPSAWAGFEWVPPAAPQVETPAAAAPSPPSVAAPVPRIESNALTPMPPGPENQPAKQENAKVKIPASPGPDVMSRADALPRPMDVNAPPPAVPPVMEAAKPVIHTLKPAPKAPPQAAPVMMETMETPQAAAVAPMAPLSPPPPPAVPVAAPATPAISPAPPFAAPRDVRARDASMPSFGPKAGQVIAAPPPPINEKTTHYSNQITDAQEQELSMMRGQEDSRQPAAGQTPPPSPSTAAMPVMPAASGEIPRLIMPDDAPEKARRMNEGPAPMAQAPVINQAGPAAADVMPLISAEDLELTPSRPMPPQIPLENSTAKKPRPKAQTASGGTVKSSQPKSPPAKKSEKSAEAKYEGFGSDIPLGFALEQIVPEGYDVALDDGVDRQQAVSWRGGKPWRAVIDGILTPLSLKSDLSGKTLRVFSANPAPDAEAAAPPAG